MANELTKGMKKRLRTLGGVAYERDLGKELSSLESKFADWRSGRLDAFELSDEIHAFHEGPSRKLYLDYSGRDLEWQVAWAIHRNIVSTAEAGPEVMKLLEQRLGLLKEQEKP